MTTMTRFRQTKCRGAAMRPRLMLLASILTLICSINFVWAAEGKENWAQVIAKAKKEGKVVVYGTTSFRPMIDQAKPLFEQRYGIKIEYLRGTSRDVRERVSTEVRTRRQIADVAQAGATSLPGLWQDGGVEEWLPPSLKLIRPEVLEAYDVPPTPITPIYGNLRGILVNTKMVPSGQEPRTWNQLTDPKWQGKILMDDPRSAGAGYSWFISTLAHPALGEKFHHQLARNKPIFLGAGSYQQIPSRIAQGEYAIGIPVDARELVTLRGSPVKWLAPSEGVAYTFMGIGLVKNAPRPNAAKLFIDFMLSEDFQRIASRDSAPVTIGVQAAQKEWSLEHASLLPRTLDQSREERERHYRLAESIYGIR